MRVQASAASRDLTRSTCGRVWANQGFRCVQDHAIEPKYVRFKYSCSTWGIGFGVPGSGVFMLHVKPYMCHHKSGGRVNHGF